MRRSLSQRVEEAEGKTVRVQVLMAEEPRNKFKSVTAAEKKAMSEVILDFVKAYVEEKTVKKPAKSS